MTTLTVAVCDLALELHRHCQEQVRVDPAFDVADYVDLVLTELRTRIEDLRVGEDGYG